MRYIRDKVETILNTVKKSLVKSTVLLDGFMYAEADYGKITSVPENIRWKSYNGEKLTETDKHYWFKNTVTMPPKEEGTVVQLRISTGHDNYDATCLPQITLTTDSGVYVFDTMHHTAHLPAGKHELLINFYTVPSINTHLVYNPTVCEFKACIETVFENVLSLIYDMSVLIKTYDILPENSFEATEILSVLDRACMLLDLRRIGGKEYLESVDKVHAFLSEYYDKFAKNPKNEFVDIIGHSHIDVAWLWRVCQGYEKAQRTLYTAVRLMEKYPEFKFMFTQPVLLEKVKENAPDLFAKLQKYAQEGRFVPDGAMWLEPDTNLPSGESLVRQTLWGKRFIMQNFGIDSKCLWLPDVFGYSAALPQILKKCGVDKFYTTKIAWNDTNRFPHTFFKWEGIDGTDIWAMLLHKNVGITLYPKEISKTRNDQNDKTHISSTLTTFGYGDGGGGPTEEMMEYYARMKNSLPGLPCLKMTTPEEYFEKEAIEFENASSCLKDTPKWVGELYLELHRGTLTSIEKIKRDNRRAEFLCHNLELISSSLMTNINTPYPEKTLSSMWRTVLLNQFHDIIPGSSIKDVYDDSDAEYAEFFEKGENAFGKTLDLLASNIKTDADTVFYNPNPFEASGVVKDGEDYVFVKDIPAFGWAPLSRTHTDSVMSENGVIENGILKITLNEKGELSSVYDKRFERELVEDGKSVNRFVFYENRPKRCDAWEIPQYYTQKFWEIDKAESITHFTYGTVGGVIVKSKYMDSEIVQEITLSVNSPRIDFKTYVNWREEQTLMRVHFPTNIHSPQATYEIQYGHIERPTHRNTSFDEAKFEVCAHKWADLSEYGFGVSLMNDCKYGYSVLGGDISLSLVKSSSEPFECADICEHNFTYSLFLHNGDFRKSRVIEEAALLNNPLICIKPDKKGTRLPEHYSFVSSSNPAAVIDCVKKAEDSDAVILRIYESHNSKALTELTFGFGVKKAFVCDMLENELYEAPINSNKLKISLSNFEIQTLKIIKE